MRCRGSCRPARCFRRSGCAGVRAACRCRGSAPSGVRVVFHGTCVRIGLIISAASRRMSRARGRTRTAVRPITIGLGADQRRRRAHLRGACATSLKLDGNRLVSKIFFPLVRRPRTKCERSRPSAQIGSRFNRSRLLRSRPQRGTSAHPADLQERRTTRRQQGRQRRRDRPVSVGSIEAPLSAAKGSTMPPAAAPAIRDRRYKEDC